MHDTGFYSGQTNYLDMKILVLHCKKKAGCFNHRVVTLVPDKLERRWLREVYFGMEA